MQGLGRITRLTSKSLIVADAVCILWKMRIGRIMPLRAPCSAWAGSSGLIMLGAFAATRHAQLTFGTWRLSVHDFLRRGYDVVVQSNRGQAPCV
jgi:hypothetical protein